jgi:uncharacterized membrane protein
VVLTLIGIAMLWADRQANAPTRRVLLGQRVLGWALFHLVEEVIEHHLFGIHHVRDVPFHVPAYDWIFLAVGGVGLMLVGAALSGRTA